MGKGADTRATIVDRALAVASTDGLAALTIGRLAAGVGLSKSGLFAHFRSKQTLQLDVLQRATEVFVQRVIAPALRKPRGRPRVEALFDRWIRWTGAAELPGGCVFLSAAAEFDDQPGPVREALVATQRDWLETLATAARIARDEDHFSDAIDPAQFAYEAYAIMMAFHLYARLLDDGAAEQRARDAFSRLLDAAAR